MMIEYVSVRWIKRRCDPKGGERMNLTNAQEGKEYIVSRIDTNDGEMAAFLFSLGCYSGAPIRVAEMLATIEGSAYIERTAINNSANIIKTKNAIRKAFQTQIEGKGFSLVEILSNCPTNWGKTPAESMDWIEQNMIPYYPLGVKKEV